MSIAQNVLLAKSALSSGSAQDVLLAIVGSGGSCDNYLEPEIQEFNLDVDSDMYDVSPETDDFDIVIDADQASASPVITVAEVTPEWQSCS